MDTTLSASGVSSERSGVASPDEVIGAATHAYLRGGGEGYVADLQALLDSEDPTVRSGAATALGVIGDDRALPSLRSASADSDASVAAAAALARARLGDASAPNEACERLLEQLRYGDPEQRALAARALGALGLSKACGALAFALGDIEPEVRHDAADALAMLVSTPA